MHGRGGAGWNRSCLLFGQTLPFTPPELRALDPTHQVYVDKDGATILAEAMAASIPE